MNNLISEKPIDVRKLIDVPYLVLVLAAFARAKEFLLPLMLALLKSGSFFLLLKHSQCACRDDAWPANTYRERVVWHDPIKLDY
jgi:hypothetical protein